MCGFQKVSYSRISTIARAKDYEAIEINQLSDDVKKIGDNDDNLGQPGEGEGINGLKTGKFEETVEVKGRSGISLRLIITMRGLTGLILSLSFYSFKCYSFSEVSKTHYFRIHNKHI